MGKEPSASSGGRPIGVEAEIPVQSTRRVEPLSSSHPQRMDLAVAHELVELARRDAQMHRCFRMGEVGRRCAPLIRGRGRRPPRGGSVWRQGRTARRQPVTLYLHRWLSRQMPLAGAASEVLQHLRGLLAFVKPAAESRGAPLLRLRRCPSVQSRRSRDECRVVVSKREEYNQEINREKTSRKIKSRIECWLPACWQASIKSDLCHNINCG